MENERLKIPATEEDVKQDHAVFYVQDQRSRVYDIGVPLPFDMVLPADLEVSDEETIPAGTRIRIIQVEAVDTGDVLVGFTHDAGCGVCNLWELGLAAGPNDSPDDLTR